MFFEKKKRRRKFSFFFNLIYLKEINKSNELIEEDKLPTILIGLIRVRDEEFIEKIRLSFEEYLFDRIDETIKIYLKEFQLEKSTKYLIQKNPR